MPSPRIELAAGLPVRYAAYQDDNFPGFDLAWRLLTTDPIAANARSFLWSSPLAILVNYACHPVVLGPENLNYSADYPSEMRDTIEQGFGGDVTAFFLQGAPGDINPYLDKTPLLEDAVGQMKRTGRKIGEAALRVARG